MVNCIFSAIFGYLNSINTYLTILLCNLTTVCGILFFSCRHLSGYYAIFADNVIGILCILSKEKLINNGSLERNVNFYQLQDTVD